MSTPHNKASKGEVAKTVLMPGDPLRAKLIAQTYFDDVKLFNDVRNMFGYTGTYKGKKLSVMGSGMGVPSMGIYSYELYTQYDVENIIRIGSAGGIQDDVNLRDIVIAMAVSTNSNYAHQYNLSGTYSPTADFSILNKAYNIAQKQELSVKVGNILTSDTFYTDDSQENDNWKKMGVLAVEMETAALYMNAARLNKKALGIFTISDHLFKSEELSAEERQNSFTEMMELALDTAVEI